MYKMLQLFGLLVTAGLLSPCMAETFYVTPTLPAPADSCPQPCYTLDQFTHNSSLLSGHNNITLIFLEGIHNLSDNLTVNTGFITLQPAPNQGQPPKVIGRIDTNHFWVFRIIASNVLIEELLFENVILMLGNNNDCDVTIRQCVVFTGGLAFNLNVESSIAIKNSNLSNSHEVTIFSGKKLLIENSMMNNYGLSIAFIPNVTIVNSSISRVNGIGIMAIDSGITLRNSHIDSNDFGVFLSGGQLIEVDNSSFTGNNGMWLFNLTKIIFRDCRFDNNSGTPILAYQSTFNLSGENVFSKNIAIRGEVVWLCINQL